jgi:hypothetical protein
LRISSTQLVFSVWTTKKNAAHEREASGWHKSVALAATAHPVRFQWPAGIGTQRQARLTPEATTHRRCTQSMSGTASCRLPARKKAKRQREV